MKTLCYLPFLLGLLIGVELNAQTSGVVIYEQTIKMEIKLEGDMAQFADMLPKERKTKKELLFNETASVYQNLPATGENDAINESKGNASITIRTAQVSDEVVYNDLGNNKRTEQKEFFTRNFLIEQDMGTSKWKLTGNRKEILGYDCMEAETIENERKTTAWFAPQIPVSIGPGYFSGLPGLILAIESNEGNNIITAISIDLKPIPAKDIKKPSKGKKVTPEEFNKIREEKLEETGIKSGGSGNVQTITIIRQ